MVQMPPILQILIDADLQEGEGKNQIIMMLWNLKSLLEQKEKEVDPLPLQEQQKD